MEKSFKGANAQVRYVEARGQSPPFSPNTIESIPKDVEKQQLPPPIQLEQKKKSKTDDWWLWETFGIVGCLGCLLAIVFFLRYFDNKAAPRWSLPVQNGGTGRYNIGLNAILSILSTAAKLCVLIPISKGISQLKWVWFSQKDRYLEDIDRFEWASKSFTGSVLLMWKLRFRHFAAFAAFAMAVSVIWDPFIQNVIKYSTQEEPVAGIRYISDQEAKLAQKLPQDFSVAAIPIAIRTPEADNQFSQNGEADMFLKAFVYNSVFSTGYEWLTTSASCSTGNCTWPPYLSMGVKSRCADVTDKLDVVIQPGTEGRNTTNPDGTISIGPVINAALPNGVSLNRADDNDTHSMVFAISPKFEPLVFQNYTSNNQTMIVKFQSILVLDQNYKKGTEGVDLWTPVQTYYPNTNSQFHAMECVMFPVLQAWNVRTSAGTTSSKDHGKAPGLTGYQLLKEYEVAKVDPQDSSKVILQPPEDLGPEISPEDAKWMVNRDKTFELSSIKLSTMNKWLIKHIAGRVEPKINGGFNYTRDNGEQQDGFFLSLFFDIQKDNWVARTEQNICGADVSSAQCAMESMARAASNSWNSLALLAGGKEGVDYVNVQGLTFVGKTWIRIQWFWLIVPAVLWVMGLIVLIATAMKTRNAGIRTWRDNPLPMLFMDIDENERREVRDHDMTEQGIAKKSKALKLSLAVGEREAHLAKRESLMSPISNFHPPPTPRSGTSGGLASPRPAMIGSPRSGVMPSPRP